MRTAGARGERPARLKAFRRQVVVPLLQLIGQQRQRHRLRLVGRVHALSGVDEDEIRLFCHAKDAGHLVVGDQLETQGVAIESGRAIEVAIVEEEVAGAHAEVAHGALGRRQHIAQGKRLHARVHELAESADGAKFVGVRRARGQPAAGAPVGDRGERQHGKGEGGELGVGHRGRPLRSPGGEELVSLLFQFS